jgi:lipopolysaccharide transport system permease protein
VVSMSEIRELWHHRDLVVSFAVRDIKARYKQTVFGIAWAVLQPFSLMIVFTLVFSRFAKIDTHGVPYPVFAYTTLIFWTFFATTVSQGTLAIVANSSLVRKIYFPRETLLVSIVLSAGLDLVVAGLVFVGMLVFYGVPVTATILWVPALLILQTIFAFGIICFTSALHTNFRDIGHGIPLAMQLWMFATPVAYPLTVVPSSLLPLYLLNPMASIIDGYRLSILGASSPHLPHLAMGAIGTLLFTAVGYVVFKQAERTFADVI